MSLQNLFLCEKEIVKMLTHLPDDILLLYKSKKVLRDLLAVLLYRIIFLGQNEKIGNDISDLLRPNCPLDRLTNDNNSKIKPDNTNKIFAVRSTIFQDSSFVCQAKIICNLLFEQKIIENLLFRANTDIEIADLFFFLGWKTSK